MRININKAVLVSVILSIFGLNVFFSNCSKVGFPYSTNQIANQGPRLINNAANCGPKTLSSQQLLQSQAINMSEKISKRVFSQKSNQLHTQSNQLIASGTQFMMRIDQECLNRQGSITFLSQLANEKLRPYSDTALDKKINYIDIEIPVEISQYSFQQMVYDDPCILYLDLSEKMKLMQVQSFNDPYFANQQHLDELKLASVSTRFFNPDNGIKQTVKVGIVDTGADTIHPDLNSLFARDSQNQIIAWPTDGKFDPTTDSGNHGTHVAGLVGAIGNNGKGTVGIMYRNLILYLSKATDDGEEFFMSDINNALLWQKDQGVSILNFSIGTTSASDSLKKVLNELASAGITVVTAAGNSAELLDTTPTYPAVWNNEIIGLVSVGSYDTTTIAISAFSNYSAKFVDILAPGAHRSMSPNAAGLVSTVPNGYQGLMGTSMAAPVVTGALALTKSLIESRGVAVSNAQLKSLLLKSALSQSQFLGKSKNSAKLSLEKLIDTVDEQTGIDSKTTKAITNAGGKLEIDSQMRDAYAMIGYPAELTVKLTSDSTILTQYQWFKNGLPINGATNSSLILNKTVSSDFTNYYVVISSGSKSIQSETINLNEASQFCIQ